MNIFRYLLAAICLVSSWHVFADLAGDVKREKQIESSVMLLDTSPGQLVGLSRDREEYYVIDDVSSKLENKILLQIRKLNDGSLKKMVRLDMGDCVAPSELCSPTFVQFCDGKFFLYDLNRKIAVYNSEFKWLFSSRYYKDRHFVDFWGKDPDNFFVLGEYRISRDRGELLIALNSFTKSHLVREDKIVDKFFVEYKRKRYAKNGVQFVEVPYFSPIINGFEQCGKIIYCINTKNNYSIYDPVSGSKKVVIVPQLEGKVYSGKEARLAGYFKTDGFEERRKKAGLVLKYIPYHEKVYHLGMVKISKDLVGFISSIDFRSTDIMVEIIHVNTGKYIESVKLPVGKNFFKGLSMVGPGFNQTFFCYDKQVYIWQDVDDDFETITCFGVLKKEKK